MQPGAGFNLGGLQTAVNNMAKTLADATAKMQSIIAGQQKALPTVQSAEPMGAMSSLAAGFNIGAIMMAGQKFKGMIQESISTLIDSFSAGFDKMKGIIIDTVGAFRPFEVEMFNRAILDLKAVFGSMFLPILQQVTALVRQVADYFYSLPQAFKDTIGSIGKLTLVFGGLAIVVGAILAAGAAAMTVAAPFVLLAAAFPVLLTALAPVLIPLAAIAAGFTILGAALIAFNWKGIVKTFEQLWAAIEATGQAIWDQLKPVWQELKAAFAELSNQFGELFEALKPLLGAVLLGAALVIKTVVSLIIQGLTLLVEGMTWVVKQINALVKSFGLPGFALPDVSRPQQSAFGLGQHGGTVTDPLAAFKTMQEDILKFAPKGEAEKPAIDKVAEYSKTMNENIDFIAKFLKEKLADKQESESTAHEFLRKGAPRFMLGKIAGKLF